MTTPNPSNLDPHSPADTDNATPPLVPRRGPHLLTLAVGLVALGVAASTLLGGTGWLPAVDVRWMLAAVAILIGLLLVVGSVRPRRR